MLKEFLKRDVCSNCKTCCSFDGYELLETPYITPQIADKMISIKNDIKLLSQNTYYRLKITKEDLNEDGLFLCPMLDIDKGCLLGDEKPFECSIFPFKIMYFKGERVITISKLCKELYSRSLKELVDFLKKGLAHEIFNYAYMYPQIITKYDDMNIILITE